jgi:glycosyltransferase involved in cell wall biosynthesis
METMKIAFVMIRLGFGGAEVQSIDLINNLVQSGWNIKLYCLNSETELLDMIDKRIEVKILKKNSFLDITVIKSMIKNMKEYNPDFIVSVNTYAMLYGFIVNKFLKNKAKHFIIQHTTILHTRKDKIHNLLYKKLMNRIDKVIFVCGNQRKYWVEKYGIKEKLTKVIYNGIDFDRFKNFKSNKEEMRKSLGLSTNDVVIGVNAVFRPEKKHEDVIDALEKLIKAGHNVKLLFIGDGARREYLEDYIKEKDLCGEVIITGFTKDVRPYLDIVDIAVISSVAVETFSISILESMAMGKPIIASNIGGASEQVQIGGNGFLYPAGIVNELVVSIEKIIKDNLYEKMGRKSMHRVENEFNRQNMISEYAGLFLNYNNGG